MKSSVGRKLVNGVTGLALIGFIIVHLGGNLTMFVSADLFNTYAHHLEGLGPLLWLAEIILVAFFLFHIVSGVSVWLDKRRARPEPYAVVGTKGGPSRSSMASRSMILTGAVLAVFVPIHVWMFKYNGGQAFHYYDLHGKQVKDLFAVVETAFHDVRIAGLYVLVMVLLGVHLRHGFWSVVQTLGAMKPKWSGPIYAAGLIFALLIAGGFIGLPVWIYLSAACGTGGCCAAP
ncbi:MAG TPA: succinate dehydrogenase cytochrome b subunit [Kiritimatiellia bacterium]